MFSQESDIVKTMRLIEALKAELIINVGGLYKAFAGGSEDKIKEMLGQIVVHCYVLGRRLGINFADLDDAVKERAVFCGKGDDEAETRFGDYSRLARHLESKR